MHCDRESVHKAWAKMEAWMAWVVSAAVLLLVCCWVTFCILARMFHSATKFSPEYSEWVENKNKNKKEADCRVRAE